jgi:hypothetical protein
LRGFKLLAAIMARKGLVVAREGAGIAELLNMEEALPWE